MWGRSGNFRDGFFVTAGLQIYFTKFGNTPRPLLLSFAIFIAPQYNHYTCLDSLKYILS